ncbi:hypothetical protein F4677DRAFT_431372 [Hypoxylon crocopeplum]|nr:hypothetical protein F4677DRAFT_431372 [Hypoxylon crocopeplum]
MRIPKHLHNPDYKRGPMGQYNPNSYRPKPPIERTIFGDNTTSLWAWPSRGSLVVLRDVTSLDFASCIANSDQT